MLERARKILAEKEAQDQAFLSSLTPETLRGLYEQMFSKDVEQSAVAIYKWGMVVQKLPGTIKLSDAFDTLKGLALNSTEWRVQRAAHSNLASIFAETQDVDVCAFLASQVCCESLEPQARLAAYYGLWTVTRQGLKRKRRVPLRDKPQPKPSFKDAMLDLESHLLKDREDSAHFMKAMRPGFSLDMDVRWSWVRSYL